jgi:hypothetical protein
VRVEKPSRRCRFEIERFSCPLRIERVTPAPLIPLAGGRGTDRSDERV